MQSILERASHFPYHSFLYEQPSKFETVIDLGAFLGVAEIDQPHKGLRIRLFWAANTEEDLMNGLAETIRRLTSQYRSYHLFLEHIPVEFLPALEMTGYLVVSEWVDFWIDDIRELEWELACDATIRPVRPEEYRIVADVTQSCRGLSREFYGESDAAAVKEWDDDHDTEIFVAEVAGEIIGACFMAHYGFDHPKGSVAWLRELAVDPRYQQQGIGWALAVSGLQWGKSRGAKRSFLATDVENEPAIRLYQALGYRQKEGRGQINVVKTID